jgi:hypothetical protein
MNGLLKPKTKEQEEALLLEKGYARAEREMLIFIRGQLARLQSTKIRDSFESFNMVVAIADAIEDGSWHAWPHQEN